MISSEKKAEIVAKYGKDCVPYVKEYVQSMKQAVERA